MSANISRHTGQFEQYPIWPEGTPDFPTVEQIYEYLNAYAEHFKLHPHIQYDAEVVELHPNETRWELCWKRGGESHTDQFDHVIVATTKFSMPSIPAIEGMDTLPEQTAIHSAYYRTPESFKDQRVLVVGGSFSGTSIAEELAEAGVEVIHSFRKKRWLVPRYISPDVSHLEQKLPRDVLYYPQNPNKLVDLEHYEYMREHCGEQNYIEELRIALDAHAGMTIADTYLDQIGSGKLLPIASGIKCFHGNQVTFLDGREERFDKIIFSTGFTQKGYLPFLPAALQEQVYSYSLYEDMFSPDFPNIALNGFYLGPRAASFPIFEKQGEYAAAIFSGRALLPSPDEMREAIRTRPTKSPSHTDYVKGLVAQSLFSRAQDAAVTGASLNKMQ